jgi:hypothetical protein
MELVDEKLENEVAVMRSVKFVYENCSRCFEIKGPELMFLALRFVQQKTAIPVLRIHGYATKKRSPIGFAFMLIDYVDGVTLSSVGLSSLDKVQRTRLYDQLADIFIQFRPHELSGWTLDSHKLPSSIDLIEQEVEGLSLNQTKDRFEENPMGWTR